MYAVIMAGGKGTRFWPMSRERLPKHLLDILGERTVIQQTVDRLQPLIPPERILIVTVEAHADALMRQVPEIPRENIIIEPVGRNTAPCIGLAAIHIRRRTPDAVMAVLPADHMIGNAARFRVLLDAASRMAARSGDLITLGIEPRSPETGYGYLEQGGEVGAAGGESFYRVTSMREKPDAAQAEEFLRRGGFLWNSGMFVWKTSSILAAIATWLPDLYQGLQEMGSALATESAARVVDRVYRTLRPISIDYGVMEKAGNLLLARGDFGWSDVGSWDALWEVAEKDEAGNAWKGKGTFLGIESKNSLLVGNGKLVALVGVEDLIVVQTDDALLICRRGDSQSVKKVVRSIAASGKTEYL
jgi:mannose-1-phosphate guanylyltransferase